MYRIPYANQGEHDYVLFTKHFREWGFICFRVLLVIACCRTYEKTAFTAVDSKLESCIKGKRGR